MTIKICMPDVPSRDARVLTDGARVVGCGRTDGNGGGGSGVVGGGEWHVVVPKVMVWCMSAR